MDERRPLPPLENTGRADAPTDYQLRSLHLEDTNSGRTAERAGGPILAARRKTRSPKERLRRPPDWARALAKRRATPEEVLADVVKRLRSGVSEEKLLEAEAVLNEIVKDPKSAEIVMKAITPELLREFLPKER